MPKKHHKKKSSKKSRVVLKKLIIFWLAVVGVLFALFTQTQTWFFFISTKERVDFSSATGKYDSTRLLARIDGKTTEVPPPQQTFFFASQILGETATAKKRIEVDLTNQKIYAYEEDSKVYEFPVSSGKPWWATPTGIFKIWVKLRYTRMRGGSAALGTYYDLPNVPYTMYFSNDKIPQWKGYGIHGAYWHNNFGHPMSHGCVNMKTEDVAQLYQWATPTGEKGFIKTTDDNPGTMVVIYGETPKS